MKSTIAAIHVAKKQLGLDEDTYRAKLEVITGKTSVKNMTEAEREKVLNVFRSEGFKPKADRRPNGRLKLSGRFAGKLQALWIAGWNLGIFDHRDDAALEAFVKRQTGLDAVRFCRDAVDARKAIEALKAILAREGGVDWTVNNLAQDFTQTDGHRVARAQWRKLGGAPADFWPVVTDLIDFDVLHRDFSSQQWIEVMNALGKRIRAAKKAGAQ
ncbi:gp16 family protein [Rhizobium sp. C1]|uniref:gp16 family protein n=1 Tax=Rhizobium sp. C1 TaxID=1349799 RepID=UPI001E306027|nr:regulatory protein GemA [Rhizobium sp. C1]MCD2176468.1 regulatory protein GemA [Rhizobium sp. C1]